MNYVIGLINGDSLDIFRREDDTIVVFDDKKLAEKLAEELGLNVFIWC